MNRLLWLILTWAVLASTSHAQLLIDNTSAKIKDNSTSAVLTGQGGGNAAGGLYRNLRVARTGVNTVRIQADGLIVTDGNTAITLANIDVSPDISASVGANGPDASGLDAINSWKSIWVIWNGGSAAGLLSASQTAPTMPSGYTWKTRVGWVRNDGSSNFVWFHQNNNKTVWSHRYAVVLSNGLASTNTDINPSAVVPPSCTKIRPYIYLSGAGAGYLVDKTSGSDVHALSQGVDQFAVDIPLDSAQAFQYRVSSTGGLYIETFAYWDEPYTPGVNSSAGGTGSQQGRGQFSNLLIEYASTNSVTVTADYLTLSDGTTARVIQNVSVVPNISSAVGANGPDASGLDSASAWRSVWVIHNGSTAAGLFSASQTAPTMPSGYTHKIRVGWVRNDASSNFLPLTQVNNSVSYRDNEIIVGGSPGTATTFSPVDCSAAVPPSCRRAFVRAQANCSTGSNTVYWRTPDSTMTTYSLLQAGTVGVTGDMTWARLSSTQQGEYKHGGTSPETYILVQAYEDTPWSPAYTSIEGSVSQAKPGGLYSNLVVEYNTTNSVTVTADELALKDSSTGNVVVLSNVSVLPDISAAVGANGPDATGLDSVSAWRSIWVIYNGSTAAGLLSTSTTAPTMPSGYTYKRRVGWVRNNASSDLIIFIQVGNAVITRDNIGSIVAGGSWLTFTEADASAGLPPTSRVFLAQIRTETAGNNDVVIQGDNAVIQRNTYVGAVSTVWTPIATRANRTFDTRKPSSGQNFFIESVGWTDNL